MWFTRLCLVYSLANVILHQYAIILPAYIIASECLLSLVDRPTMSTIGYVFHCRMLKREDAFEYLSCLMTFLRAMGNV